MPCGEYYIWYSNDNKTFVFYFENDLDPDPDPQKYQHGQLEGSFYSTKALVCFSLSFFFKKFFYLGKLCPNFILHFSPPLWARFVRLRLLRTHTYIQNLFA